MAEQKKYHLYGLGNALVDIDLEITPGGLNKFNIEKGVMTLIDSDRYLQLLEDLAGMKHIKACGGSVANTVVAMSMLGSKTFYSCKVASDSSGDFFYEELKRNGVTTNLNGRNRPHGTTGACLVLVTPDADRTMNTHLGISETLSRDELDPKAIAESEYLYLEGYLSSSPTGSDAAIEAYRIARENNTKIAISLSDPNMVKFFHARLHEMIDGYADLIFCNEDEAKLFCKNDDLAQVCECLKKHAKTFAITQGPQGSLVFDGKTLYDVGAQDVPVIDTVGAGDMFAGGFIWAITNGYDYNQAGIIGDIVASKVISKYGPRLNTEEMEDVKRQIKALL